MKKVKDNCSKNVSLNTKNVSFTIYNNMHVNVSSTLVEKHDK